MTAPSASFSYLETLIDNARTAGDTGRLRELDGSLRSPADLTDLERDELRGRIWSAIAAVDAVGDLDVTDLARLCAAGNRDAGLELDRRGIKQPMLELDPPPVPAVT